MKTDIKTYGFRRKGDVPKLSGSTPKPCPKCEDWFAAFWHERVCDRCTKQQRSPAHERGRQINSKPGTGGRQVKISARNARSAVPKITGLTLLNGVSFGCRFPKEQQAEILTVDQIYRHPYNGKRPLWSGYCIGGCLCECHGPKQDMDAVTKNSYTRRNVALGLQGKQDLERYST